jgi:hypothetical protein
MHNGNNDTSWDIHIFTSVIFSCYANINPGEYFYILSFQYMYIMCGT